MLGKLIANAPVGADVRSTKPVDGLFRVADDEQLPGTAVREQQQDFRLDGIGILEFIHENSGELGLKMPPDRLVRLDEISCVREQVGEVQHAGRGLQILITRSGSCQFLLEARRQVAVRFLLELLKPGKQRRAPPDIRPRAVLPASLATALAHAGHPRSRRGSTRRASTRRGQPARTTPRV